MINKESFIAIMNQAYAYYNGDILKAFDMLGMGENVVNDVMDGILEAINNDVDPQRHANLNDLTKDCGSYIWEWLLGPSEFNEVCKTAEELYDYIIKEYEREPIVINKH